MERDGSPANRRSLEDPFVPYFVVIRERGPAWDWSLPMRAQPEFEVHAEFMDALEAGGFIVAGGPLGSEDHAKRIMHVVEAADASAAEQRLNEDPWKADRLRTAS